MDTIRDKVRLVDSLRGAVMSRRSNRVRKMPERVPPRAEQEARAQGYRARFTVITSKGHTRREPEPTDRWLMLADKLLLDAAREEQQRIKEKIKPHVERYQNITGNKE